MSLIILIHSQYAQHTTSTEQDFLNFYITFLQSFLHTHQSVFHAPQLFDSSFCFNYLFWWWSSSMVLPFWYLHYQDFLELLSFEKIYILPNIQNRIIQQMNLFFKNSSLQQLKQSGWIFCDNKLCRHLNQSK